MPSSMRPDERFPTDDGVNRSGRPDRAGRAKSAKGSKGAGGAKRSSAPRSDRSSFAADAGRRQGPRSAGLPATVPAFDFGDDLTAASPSHRVAQVSSLIARVLQDRLARGLNDPRVQGMVSILGVECTADLVSAQVRISVLPADRAKLAISGIRSATRHLEGVIRKATRLRKVPRLQFLLDDSLKREAALDLSLRASLAQLEPVPEPPDGDDEPPEPSKSSG
jgi:ribosome-binding factor A